MNIKKSNCLIIFALLFMIILSGCGGSNVETKRIFTDFSRLIEDRDYENLRLTIYFRNPLLFPPRSSVNVERLIELYPGSTRKFIVEGNALVEHSYLLHQLSNVDMILPECETLPRDVRIYYFIENMITGKMFEVVIQGCRTDPMFVNGVEIEWNEIFYDVIIPFLPEDAVESVEVFLGRR